MLLKMLIALTPRFSPKKFGALNTGNCFIRRFQVYPEYGNRTLTFCDLALRGARVSLALKSRGIGPGNVVLVVSTVRPSFLAITVGTLLRGAIVATTNPANDAGDFKRLLNRIQPTMVISEPGETAQTIRDNVKKGVEVLDIRTCGADDLSFLESGQSLVNLSDIDSYAEPDPDDVLKKPALIYFTSGTSGFPKGSVITNENVQAFVQAYSNSGAKTLEGLTLMQYTPMFWLSGIGVQFIALMTGNMDVILTKFKADVLLNAVNKFKVHFIFMEPYAGMALSRIPEVSEKLGPVRALAFTGAAMDSQTQSMVQTAVKRHTIQFFGMTELLLITTDIPGKLSPIGSVGVPQMNTEVKIIDNETKEILGPNEKGELLFKSPLISPGYYRDPDATALVRDEEGWFHTGDVAYYDEQGYLYVVDRFKDLIKYRGFHVVPLELEGILMSHPAVKEASVVGVPSVLDVELPRAYVVLHPGSEATEEQLKDFVASKVADHKQLRGGVKFVDSLPRTATSKVKKEKLKELAKQDAVTHKN